jgi:outer membrane protein TolC
VVRALALALLVSSAALAEEAAAPAARLTLDDAVKLALQRNPDLVRQSLLSLSAEQDQVIARAAILPSLSLSASATDTRQGATDAIVVAGFKLPGQPTSIFQTYAGSASLRQLVFDGGKWWNNLSASDLAHDSSQAQVDEQRLQITYLVEQRFYELVRAQRQLLVLAEAGARSRDQADFTQRLFEGGRATQADVYAARANRDNDEINRLGQERQVELARADLAVAIGVDPGEPLTVAEPPRLMEDPAQPPPARDAVAKALEARPSLKAASLTVQANRKAASAAGGDYWPTVSLAASYQRSASDVSSLLNDPTRNSTLAGSVNLSWNVFSGFATQASARKAELQALVSENDLANARRSVASDVEKAVAQLAAARSQARVAQQAQQTAQEGLRLARTRQEVGVGTQLEVRDAELKLTQAQLSVVGSLVDGREAEAALRRAQGG